jgi:hypothetical protein
VANAKLLQREKRKIPDKLHSKMEGQSMATIRVVVNFRVKAGKEGELLQAAGAFKKVVERLGGAYLVVRQVAGPETGNIVVVHQYTGWDHFAKAVSDREGVQLMEAVRRDTSPPYESFTVSISEEVAL